MVTTTTPVSRKRCNLCLAILEISHVFNGAVCKLAFDGHTQDSCRRATEARIKALEEIHLRDSREIEGQARVIDDLGAISSIVGLIADRGAKWISWRGRARAPGDPEGDLIRAIDLAIAAFESRGKS